MAQQMPIRNYRISKDLFEAIENEFKTETIAKKYLESKDPDLFKEYGKNLMERTYELGSKPEYSDRILELIQMAAKDTGGEVRFPHEPQRYIEIAYLSVHFMGIVRIRVNNMKELTFSVNEKDCGIYRHLKEGLSEEELKALPCQEACMTAVNRIFELLKMDNVSVSQTEKMTQEGVCTFCAQKQ